MSFPLGFRSCRSNNQMDRANFTWMIFIESSQTQERWCRVVAARLTRGSDLVTSAKPASQSARSLRQRSQQGARRPPDEEAVEQFECHRRHGEEVEHNDHLTVILEKGKPLLPRVATARHPSQLTSHTPFGDDEAELLKLSVDLGGAPA